MHFCLCGNLPFLLLIAILSVFIFRVVFVLSNRCSVGSRRGKYKSVKTVVVIGSGGHTTEMMRVLKHFNPQWYAPRVYILAKGDKTSESKIFATEKEISHTNQNNQFILKRIPRSREVGQSYFTSVFTTLYSIIYSVPVMINIRPDLVLCNGPGTCIPICVIAFLLKVFYISHVTVIFVESVCRVNTLSLSGKILLYFADVVFVQWPQLHTTYKQTKYLGRLV